MKNRMIAIIIWFNLFYFGNPFYLSTAQDVRIERYPNGAVYHQGTYVDGKKEGLETEYSLTGSLRAVWNFHKGLKEGIQKGWYDEGPRKFEYYYHQGILEGESVEWHLNGAVYKRQFFENGLETERKVLYSGSEIFTNYSKKNGRTYGIDGGNLCFEVKKDGER